MGFKEAKRVLIESPYNMEFTHFTERSLIWEKNILYSGEVNVNFVLNIIKECEEKHYFPENSWDADDKKSHTFINGGWYIKYIILKGTVSILSVHEDEHYD